MPQTFIPCADHLEDLSTITASSAAIFEAKGMREDAARDLSAKARGYASWDEMLSQSWSLSDEGMLAGRLDGRRIEIDVSVIISLPVMPVEKAWAMDVISTSVKILLPGEEPFERILLSDPTSYEEIYEVNHLGIREDLCTALQATSNRLPALALVGINIAKENSMEPGHTVDGLPMQRADALEFARRFFKDMNPQPQVFLEEGDDFPVPQMDDLLIYGLAFQKIESETGPEFSVFAISSCDTELIATGGAEIADAIFTLEVSETGHIEDKGLGDVVLVRDNEVEDVYWDILETADPGYEF